MLFKKKEDNDSVDIESLKKWAEMLNKMDEESLNFQYNRIYNNYHLWREELKQTKENLTLRIGIIGAIIAIYFAVFITLFTTNPSDIGDDKLLLYLISFFGLICYSIYFYMNPAFTYDTIHYKSAIHSLPIPSTYTETVVWNKRTVQLMEIVNWVIDTEYIKKYVEKTNTKYDNKSITFHIFVIESLLLVVLVILSSVSEITELSYMGCIVALCSPIICAITCKIASIIVDKIYPSSNK